MDSPPEITFHNMEGSEAIAQDIRKRVGKLEKVYGRLTSCRVSIERRGKQHRTGNVYEVHVEMCAPGGRLAVSREPHHVEKRHVQSNLRGSVRDAFKAAEDQLRSFSERRQQEVKPHPTPLQGTIAELYAERDYGFIRTNESARLYFHRNSLMDGAWETLKRGDAVRFIEAEGDTGPTAVKVWLSEVPRNES
jgi:cold shock CspA family protein/ribosome-associated translation inhibitor RaiA